MEVLFDIQPDPLAWRGERVEVFSETLLWLDGRYPADRSRPTARVNSFITTCALPAQNTGRGGMPRGLRQIALSISFLSPIVRRPDAFAATKIASLIFRPERRFLVLTSFQSLRRPSLSFGSSLISLRRQSLSLSRARLRPPGNIQRPSRFRLTRSARPRFAATSFDDFAIP
jgi:hypothetical protein